MDDDDVNIIGVLACVAAIDNSLFNSFCITNFFLVRQAICFFTDLLPS
jgi:hypothetical protein